MRVCGHQIRMSATVQGNLDAVCRAVAESDAELHVFPECTLTGFHRGLPELVDSEALQDSGQILQEIADQTGSGLLIGRPQRTSRGVLNTMLLLVPGQAPQWTAKRGLTPSEARFFTVPESPGPGRESSDHSDLLVFRERRLGVLFCREVLDPLEHVAGAELLIWPGYIQWDEDNSYRRAAQAHCRRLGVPLLQANWADSINAPKTRGLGGSLRLDGTGAIRDEARLDRPETLSLQLSWGRSPR